MPDLSNDLKLRESIQKDLKAIEAKEQSISDSQERVFKPSGVTEKKMEVYQAVQRIEQLRIKRAELQKQERDLKNELKSKSVSQNELEDSKSEYKELIAKIKEDFQEVEKDISAAKAEIEKDGLSVEAMERTVKDDRAQIKNAKEKGASKDYIAHQKKSLVDMKVALVDKYLNNKHSFDTFSKDITEKIENIRKEVEKEVTSMEFKELKFSKPKDNMIIRDVGMQPSVAPGEDRYNPDGSQKNTLDANGIPTRSNIKAGAKKSKEEQKVDFAKGERQVLIPPKKDSEKEWFFKGEGKPESDFDPPPRPRPR